VAYPCVFCGQLKASKEHVYPKWLRSLQAPYDGVISVVETPQGNQVRPTQVPFDITVNTVCRDCNTGWMHDLEEATRPLLTRMIRGQLCELTLTDQHLLAQWVYKTVLMIHEQSRAASLVPPEHFKSLFKARVPPAGTAIWLATQTAPVVGPVSSVVFSTIDHHQIEDGQIPGGLDGTTFYSAGLAIGAFCALLFANVSSPIQSPLPSAEANSYVVSLWPSTGPQSWPPPSTDGVGGFIAFYERIFGA
jgi:hypothetical protein